MPLPPSVVSFDLDSGEIKEPLFSSFRIHEANPREIYWIHVSALDSEFPPILRDLGITEETWRKWKSPDPLPEVTETEDSLTLILHLPDRLILHLTSRYCLTVVNGRIPALERFAATYRREFRFAETPGFVLFLILDYLVDDFTHGMRRIEERSEAIDEKIEREFSEGMNQSILDLKREIITFKHFVSSLRDALMRISAKKIPVVSEHCRQSLGDVYQHAQALLNQLDSLRELAHNSLEAYNTAISLRMNKTMKVLTLFTAIVLPMSLIAGIYGMNFDRMPELGWRYGYPWALAFMAASGVGLLVLFKKKGWF